MANIASNLNKLLIALEVALLHTRNDAHGVTEIARIHIVLDCILRKHDIAYIKPVINSSGDTAVYDAVDTKLIHKNLGRKGGIYLTYAAFYYYNILTCEFPGCKHAFCYLAISRILNAGDELSYFLTHRSYNSDFHNDVKIFFDPCYNNFSEKTLYLFPVSGMIL